MNDSTWFIGASLLAGVSTMVATMAATGVLGAVWVAVRVFDTVVG